MVPASGAVAGHPSGRRRRLSEQSGLGWGGESPSSRIPVASSLSRESLLVTASTCSEIRGYPHDLSSDHVRAISGCSRLCSVSLSKSATPTMSLRKGCPLTPNLHVGNLTYRLLVLRAKRYPGMPHARPSELGTAATDLEKNVPFRVANCGPGQDCGRTSKKLK